MAERNKNIPITEFQNKELLEQVLAELLNTTVEILDANLEDSHNNTDGHVKENIEPKKKHKHESK